MITVIVPMYNAENTICNQLIALRKSKIPLVVLIINDGSNDNSKEVCQDFILKNSNQRIKFVLLNKDHSGLSATLNFAINYVNTEFFTIFDADDVVDAHLFSIFSDIKNKNNYDLFCWNTGLSKSNSSNNIEVYNHKTTTFKIVNDGSFAGYNWNKPYRTKIVKSNKIRFDPSIKLMLDKLFAIEYWNCCRNNSIFLNHVYYFYDFQEKEQKYNYKDFCTCYDASKRILNVPIVKNNSEVKHAEEAILVHLCTKSARTTFKHGNKDITRYINTSKLYRNSLLKSKDFSFRQKLRYFVLTKASWLLPYTSR